MLKDELFSVLTWQAATAILKNIDYIFFYLPV